MKLDCEPYYKTKFGAAYLGNSLELMANISSESIDLICTSPPFALVRKKEYGNVDADEYVEWFKDYAAQFHRILKPTGSLVIDIGGSWIKGMPVRSLYHFELVVALCKAKEKGGLGFYLAQELYWYNPAKLPTPAEWVTVRRERVKDSVNTIWWLSKEPHPKANNRRVLKPYSDAMKNLIKNGYKAKLRPSGHDISNKFGNDRGGAIPPNIIDGRCSADKEEIGQPVLLQEDLVQPVNLISASNTASNDYYQRRCKEEGFKPHPARFPQALPEFVINLCTEPGDIVLEPFAGSNMTGRVAESLQRRWLAFEIDEDYIKSSKLRFEENAPLVVEPPADLPPYGHQFEPAKFSLVEILELCKECQPSRDTLEGNIAQRYFSQHSKRASSRLASSDNISKLAMNCFLSLRAYQLIEDLEQPRQYKISPLAEEILSNANNAYFGNRRFAAHILNNLSGMALLKAIDAINARGEEPQLESIAYELQERGYAISPNAIYTSTMRSWLSQASVFEREYEINWDVVSEILGINKDFIDELYTLTPGQKHFLLSLLNLELKEFTPANKVAQHTRSVYKLRLTTKNLVKDVIDPLANLGLIETEKTTGGRGAKPNNVRLTSKAQSELLAPLLKSIANETRLSEIELNRTFDDVVNDLNHPDKHIKGKALELLAIWMIRLTSLRFTKWRSRENGKGEVDVLAASDRFVYSRWQIQCKNTNKVDIDVLAKEIGLTFVTGADVVMVVTTGEFTRDAYQYAYRMMEVSRYYMILLQKDDIEAIKRDKTNIVEILDRKARRVFAKKELDVSEEELNEIEHEEDLMARAIEDEIDDNN